MRRAARKSGLTLLELLVSMAILASLVTLTAALWAQARSWAQETEGHLGAAAVAHAGALLQDQWSMRRTHVRLDSAEGPAVESAPGRLTFVTGLSAQEPSRGLVRATYSVVGAEEEGWSLVYEEIALTNATVAENPRAVDETTGQVAQTTLLVRCDDLRWERLVEWTEAGDNGGASVTRRAWLAVGTAVDSAPGKEAATVRAYRLTGARDGRWFTWALVDAASR